jgi:hypothetical protein
MAKHVHCNHCLMPTGIITLKMEAIRYFEISLACCFLNLNYDLKKEAEISQYILSCSTKLHGVTP